MIGLTAFNLIETFLWVEMHKWYESFEGVVFSGSVDVSYLPCRIVKLSSIIYFCFSYTAVKSSVLWLLHMVNQKKMVHLVAFLTR